MHSSFCSQWRRTFGEPHLDMPHCIERYFVPDDTFIAAVLCALSQVQVCTCMSVHNYVCFKAHAFCSLEWPSVLPRLFLIDWGEGIFLYVPPFGSVCVCLMSMVQGHLQRALLYCALQHEECEICLERV